MWYDRFAAGLDAYGNPVAWTHTIVGQSIMAGTLFEAFIKNGIDASSVEGAAELPYGIPNILVDLHSPKVGVPVQWWRSVTAQKCSTCHQDQNLSGLNMPPGAPDWHLPAL